MISRNILLRNDILQEILVAEARACFKADGMTDEKIEELLADPLDMASYLRDTVVPDVSGLKILVLDFAGKQIVSIRAYHYENLQTDDGVCRTIGVSYDITRLWMEAL